MNETSKSKKIWRESVEHSVLKGKGIDIGAGNDPVVPDVKIFDTLDGDANDITNYVHEQFDFVYASHCLEHMHNPGETLIDWWALVKKGGHLFFIVPDEDLYEQGVFPSRFNPDHKATFTLSKTKSWSPRSFNVLDLALSLPSGEIVSLALQDYAYDRSLMTFGPRRAQNVFLRFLIRAYAKIIKLTGRGGISFIDAHIRNYAAIDQTRNKDTLAQIQCIVRKTA